MRHIDLFSGIGGFALAVDTVWPNSEHIFVDNDPFCQAVLKKHWPNSQIHGDIRTFIADTERSGYVHGQPEVKPTDTDKQTQREPITSVPTSSLLTGGFPCQP